jgi:cytochrome c oxidase subunit 2
MTIHIYEKIILAATVAMLAVFLAAIAFAMNRHDIHLPDATGQVDPELARETVPFNSLGLTQLGPNEYHAVMLASVWKFEPARLEIPVGATVTFDITSTDLLHGFRILGTDINVMVIPGEIARMKHTFRRPGEHLIVCYEYCGTGHQSMFSTIVVGEAANPMAPIPAPAMEVHP